MANVVHIETHKVCKWFVRNPETFRAEVRDRYTDKWQVGTSCCYPTDHGFVNVCKIPARVAVTWLNEAGMMIPNPTDESVPSWDFQANWFLNKMAVVVEASWGKSLAVYKHDNSWYLIRKDILAQRG